MTKSTTTPDDTHDFLGLTARIVSAFVKRNSLPVGELPDVIKSVYGTMTGLSGAAAESAVAQRPAVPVRKSINPDYLICLEDGARLKMLKRYLRSRYNLTPEEYRVKWHLPVDYPMVAPNYAALRSEFAKKIGLGRTSSPRKARKR